jgi:hypothetical protein
VVGSRSGLARRNLSGWRKAWPDQATSAATSITSGSTSVSCTGPLSLLNRFSAVSVISVGPRMPGLRRAKMAGQFAGDAGGECRGPADDPQPPFHGQSGNDRLRLGQRTDDRPADNVGNVYVLHLQPRPDAWFVGLGATLDHESFDSGRGHVLEPGLCQFPVSSGGGEVQRRCPVPGQFLKQRRRPVNGKPLVSCPATASTSKAANAAGNSWTSAGKAAFDVTMRRCSASKSSRFPFQMTASPSITQPGGICAAAASTRSGKTRSSLPCRDHNVTPSAATTRIARKPSHLGSKNAPPGSAFGRGCS